MGSGQSSSQQPSPSAAMQIIPASLLPLLLLNSVIAQDYEYEYEEDPNAIEGLTASAADLLDKPYDDGFNCDQQDAGYGYYADTLNDCKVFHICNPVYNNDGGLDRMDKYSFVCGEGTVFDQQTLTCNFPEDAFPCQESPSLYGQVEFGKITEEYDY